MISEHSGLKSVAVRRHGSEEHDELTQSRRGRGIASPSLFWIFPPSSGSFCGPILLHTVSEAGFLMFSPA